MLLKDRSRWSGLPWYAGQTSAYSRDGSKDPIGFLRSVCARCYERWPSIYNAEAKFLWAHELWDEALGQWKSEGEKLRSGEWSLGDYVKGTHVDPPYRTWGTDSELGILCAAFQIDILVLTAVQHDLVKLTRCVVDPEPQHPRSGPTLPKYYGVLLYRDGLHYDVLSYPDTDRYVYAVDGSDGAAVGDWPSMVYKARCERALAESSPLGPSPSVHTIRL